MANICDTRYSVFSEKKETIDKLEDLILSTDWRHGVGEALTALHIDLEDVEDLRGWFVEFDRVDENHFDFLVESKWSPVTDAMDAMFSHPDFKECVVECVSEEPGNKLYYTNDYNRATDVLVDASFPKMDGEVCDIYEYYESPEAAMEAIGDCLGEQFSSLPDMESYLNYLIAKQPYGDYYVNINEFYFEDFTFGNRENKYTA
jgi:hypothetical protein